LILDVLPAPDSIVYLMTAFLIIIASVLSAWYLITIGLFLKGLLSLKQAVKPAGRSFSVIIAARNESKNIVDCLQTIFRQTILPDLYEVIVVDDRSTDTTAALVESLRKQHSNLRLIRVTETPAGIAPKKYAILEGMKKVKNDIIVLTDADCRVKTTWLETIDRFITEKTGLVQGVTVYRTMAGINPALLEFQSVDFFSHTVVSAAAIGINLPLNSNANNLAFRKKAFDEVGGYGDEESIISGDDDLLLQRIWKSGKWEVAYMADKAGAVETFPTSTLKGILEQRKRWGSITVHYNPIQTLLLAGVFLFYCAIPILLLGGIFSLMSLALGGGMLLLKIAGEYVLMVPATSRFGQKHLLKWIAPASLPQALLVIYAVLFGVFGKFKWKEQDFNRKAQ
jgi:cellulose synthase/poly-beta-1,6-N-acetylglucosamine synthase-like glycosyltransferase